MKQARLFDAHLHIIKPGFPLQPNQGYIPPPFEVETYLSQARPLGVRGGAVVAGSFQGFDQGYLIDALQTLGSGYVGVTQVPPGISDVALLNLHEYGVRALRFNLRRGAAMEPDEVNDLARRVYDLLGWHAEFYIDASSLTELLPLLKALPAIVVDHLGLEATSEKAVLDLVSKGARLKATGFGRLDFDPLRRMREVYKVNPGALMFGTDLPSTRAPRPFSVDDLARIQDCFDEDACSQILWQNARDLYLGPEGV